MSVMETKQSPEQDAEVADQAGMPNEDGVMQRIHAMNKRVVDLQAADLYFYNQPITELQAGRVSLSTGVKWGCMPLTVIWVWSGIHGSMRLQNRPSTGMAPVPTGYARWLVR